MEKQVTKELEKYFNDYFAMFNSAGWKSLKAEMERDFKIINDCQTVKDANDLLFRQGKMAVLASLLNFEATIEVAHKSAETTSEETDENLG